MIAILGAVKHELGDVSKELTAARCKPYRGWRLLEGEFIGKDVLLMQTGMGKDRAQEATKHVLEHYPITAIVFIGFGGALIAGLAVGDLVLCRKLLNESLSNCNCIHSSDPDLIATATQVMEGKKVNLLVGDALTVNRLVSHPEEKEALGKTYGAKVVDMESFWVAKVASSRKIPFLAVRAISDTLDERLPPFDRFLDTGGEMLWNKALRHFLFTPGDLIRLPPMRDHTQRARKCLTEFLRAFIPELS